MFPCTSFDHQPLTTPANSANSRSSLCTLTHSPQVICIGLFLFYMLTSAPTIIKNILIILWSSKSVPASSDKHNRRERMFTYNEVCLAILLSSCFRQVFPAS